MNLDDWLAYGLEQGWCGPAVCATYDGTPYSEAELDEFEEGNDPCVHVLRLYPDRATKAAVEADHAPSQWRKP